MWKKDIINILKQYKTDSITEIEVLEYLRKLPFEDIDLARIDHHRTLRWGFPEVILCQGKTPQQVAQIALKIVEKSYNLLATKASMDAFNAVKNVLPDAEYNETGQTITYVKEKIQKLHGKVIIATAGTSDIPIATESIETGKMLGLDVSMIADIGVAGIHRVLSQIDELEIASVIIVIAGMDGALPSVIAGLVQCPVIAVPTTIGYGASFNGLSPLLSMLNSCVPGVAVMNIDNGFGASFLAFRILNTFYKMNKIAPK